MHVSVPPLLRFPKKRRSSTNTGRFFSKLCMGFIIFPLMGMLKLSTSQPMMTLSVYVLARAVPLHLAHGAGGCDELRGGPGSHSSTK